MGEYVGVDPDRVRKLANRLQDLEGALAKHGAVIRAKFRDWDSGLDLSQIAQQTHNVGNDARDMSKRADLARNLEEHGDIGLCTPGGDMVNIPWGMDGVSKLSAKEAKQEAATLKKALDDPKATGSRADIAAIGQSLADHQNDPSYLTAFAAAGGVADAARVGHALHIEDGTHDGTVLNHASTQLIGQYGRGISQIFKYQKAGKVPPNPAYVKSLTNPPGGDMWSVGTLFKYGPKGDQWDAKVLSDVGGAMLDWRHKQVEMRPMYLPGAGYNGYTGGPDRHAWYQSLGLDPVYTNDDGANNKIVAGIQANDPAFALMDRVGENPEASRDLLTQPNGGGLRHAKELVDYKWETPGEHGPHDDSDPVRRVLTLAATDRSAAHQDQSGQAAANILKAAAEQEDTFTGRDDSDSQEQYQKYPTGTAVALAGITATWADDIGNTGLSTDEGVLGYKDHFLVANEEDMTKVMQLFVRDGNTKAAIMFDSTIHNKVSDAAESDAYSRNLTYIGNTAGMLSKAKVGVKYSAAQQKDEEHQTNLNLLNTAGTLFGFAPGPKTAESVAAKVTEKGLKYSQNMVLMGRTIVAPQTDPFSIDNADKQERISPKEAKKQYHSFIPSVAQGMIRSGRVPIPTGRSWYDPATGTVAPGPTDIQDFEAWWAQAGEKQPADLKKFQPLDFQKDFQDGFNDSTQSLDGS
ncbi:hypothetical protein [Streptomyces sp. NBC_01089]|uniref:hypothetical protein n=1 Tax=Streptomyces sp. NBC_01089 TaxID=2903747 RepID=UPI003867B540|nr:hypothetical protein OG510_05410 [Streptomyces sp. NBC_01089]